MIENIQEIESGRLDSALAEDLKNIPSKISFKIGEVAEHLKVKTHVLRYWEMEFRAFHPQKMDNGQRLYFRKDIETALLIRKLLYKDGFSVKGAKKVLAKLKREHRQFKKKGDSTEKMMKKIESMRENISNLREIIK